MNSSFKEQLNDFYSGGRYKGDIVVLEKTPDIIKELGNNDYPIVITPKNLNKCIREKTEEKQGHNLSRELIEKIPELITGPCIIFKNDKYNALVLVTEERDPANDIIIIALHMDKMRNLTEVHEVKSIYGKENVRNYINNQFEEKNCIYIDKEKATQLFVSIGLSLSLENITSSYNDIVTEVAVTVNNEKEESNEKKQEKIEYKEDIKKEIIKSGYIPSETLLFNINALIINIGRYITLQEICTLYRTNDFKDENERVIVNKIAKECSMQEIQKKKEAALERD